MRLVLIILAAIGISSCSAATQTASSLPATPSHAEKRIQPDLVIGTSNVAIYYGCPVFTAGDYYNQGIINAATDPHDTDYISSIIQAGDTSGFYASTNVEQVNNANNQTPLLTVQPDVSWHQFPNPYPWNTAAPWFYIEPLSDGHAMVVQTQSCHLFEAYNTAYSKPTPSQPNGVLSAYSGADWNLRAAFVPLAPGNPSAMASGLPLFAGMVKWEEYSNGCICHALNWTAIEHTVAQYLFVTPASDTDQLKFNGTSSYQMPYGAHLRLKSTFSTNGWGPQATAVAKAMKTYGIYLADTGTSGNGLYFANKQDGSNPWNSSDLASLGSITMSDFDVLTLPPIQHVPGHARTLPRHVNR